MAYTNAYCHQSPTPAQRAVRDYLEQHANQWHLERDLAREPILFEFSPGKIKKLGESTVRQSLKAMAEAGYLKTHEFPSERGGMMIREVMYEV